MSIVTMAPPNEKNSWKFIEFFHSSYFYCSPYNAHKNCVISEFFTALCCFMANNLHFIATFSFGEFYVNILQQSQWNFIKIILLFFVISFPSHTFVMRIIFLCNFGVALKKGCNHSFFLINIERVLSSKNMRRIFLMFFYRFIVNLLSEHVV